MKELKTSEDLLDISVCKWLLKLQSGKHQHCLIGCYYKVSNTVSVCLWCCTLSEECDAFLLIFFNPLHFKGRLLANANTKSFHLSPLLSSWSTANSFPLSIYFISLMFSVSVFNVDYVPVCISIYYYYVYCEAVGPWGAVNCWTWAKISFRTDASHCRGMLWIDGWLHDWPLCFMFARLSVLICPANPPIRLS